MSKMKFPIIDPSISFETLEETLYIEPKGAQLCIGIPKETEFQENRVALVPEAVSVLVNNGHEVLIESNAGKGCFYSDKDFSEAGAQIVYEREKVYKCPILIKSAPILEAELPLFAQGQIILSPLHHASLTKKTVEDLSRKKITAIAFEHIKDDSGTYPIVRTMSEIAGSASMLIAGQYLACSNNGKGVLLGGISGIPPTKVIIIGAGVVGEYAVRTALALGASVKIFDNNIYRLKRLQNNLGMRLWTSVIEPNILAKQLKTCEVAVGAISSGKGRTPIIVTEEMVTRMRPGSVIIDVSIDRGGCFETSVPTTLENPVYTKHDVVHYCVPNINSGFARTASQAISNVLMPMLIEIGDEGGFDAMIWADINLRSGVYLYKGYLTNFYISERFHLKYTDLNLLIASKR